MLSRARTIGIVCTACALVLPAVASADATVSLSGGQLTDTVQARAGADGNHGIIAEPCLSKKGPRSSSRLLRIAKR